MRELAELVGQQIEWVQPGVFKMHYELRAVDELAATPHPSRNRSPSLTFERQDLASKVLVLGFLCATSVFSVSLWCILLGIH